MRTTIRLDERLLRDAKQHAARTGRTLTSVIDEALRQFLAGAKRPPRREPFRVTTFKGTGLAPGVDLDNNAALRELMDEGRPLEKRR